ncbi:Ff.00g000670.m01.CDS01 [Fusarium sp. VM40]|nr:Ff.00g000670.m01.CDS01 [Fusarium sp. VM40]
MHRRFKAWMNAKRQSRQRAPQDPEIPLLPNPRPYALTPSPSQEQITTLAETVPFFRLPLELRRKILIHAFGNRTVHMDLVLTHPLREPLNFDMDVRSIDPKRRFHGQDHSHLWPYHKKNLGLDIEQPKYWQWRGCVCHRLLPPRFKATVDAHNIVKPGDDRCCDGWSFYCVLYTKFAGKPDSCWIGAMGWLLTCRQAYVEGTEILYGTNIIHISSQPLINNLGMLIRPRSLSMITSLEIVFDLSTHEHQGKLVPSQSELERNLQMLDTHFPQLISLHLGIRVENPVLDVPPRYEVTRRPVYLSDMLQSVDAFVKRRNDRPELCNFRDPFLLSIPQAAYKGLTKEVRDDNRYYVRKSGAQIWRPISAESIVLDDEGELTNATPENGYWTWGDYEDRFELEFNRPPPQVNCFGT